MDGSGQYEFEENDGDVPGRKYSKAATYSVVLPLKDEVRWPNRCSLCGASNPEKTITVADTWKSGNYLVARTRSTMQFKGVPLCRYCHKETTFSVVQWIVIVLGVILGFGTVAGVAAYDESYICGGCLGGMFVAIIFFLFGAIAIGGGIKSPAVELKVGTEGHTVGKNRATMITFNFRNEEYSDDFRKMNDPDLSRNGSSLNW